MERRATVGRIKRGPAAVRLKIDRIVWSDESRHISDRVGDHELATRAAGDMQRLIKIARTGWIDGDQFRSVRSDQEGASAASSSFSDLSRKSEACRGCSNDR
jgi:hypothetical protein